MVNASSKLQVNNNLLKIIITFSLVAFLSSCGSPTTVITRGDTSVIDKERIIMQGIALDTYYKRFEKLNNLTYPLLTKSTDFCGSQIKYDIGLKTISLNQIDKRFRKAAKQKLLITESQKVLFTVDDSPSAKAGIKSGDTILEINTLNEQWENDDIFKNNEKKNYSKEIVKISLVRKNETMEDEKKLELAKIRTNIGGGIFIIYSYV